MRWRKLENLAREETLGPVIMMVTTTLLQRLTVTHSDSNDVQSAWLLPLAPDTGPPAPRGSASNGAPHHMSELPAAVGLGPPCPPRPRRRRRRGAHGPQLGVLAIPGFLRAVPGARLRALAVPQGCPVLPGMRALPPRPGGAGSVLGGVPSGCWVMFLPHVHSANGLSGRVLSAESLGPA